MWGTAQAYTEVIKLLSESELKMRDVQKRIEQEKLKHGI